MLCCSVKLRVRSKCHQFVSFEEDEEEGGMEEVRHHDEEAPPSPPLDYSAAPPAGE